MEQASVVTENVNSKIKTQIALIKKIIHSDSPIAKRRFPDIIAFYISKFLFKNPVRSRKPIYSEANSNQLKLNLQYLLMRNSSNQPQFLRDTRDVQITERVRSQNEKDKQKLWVTKDKNTDEHSCYLTLLKNWKSMVINEADYNQVLQKGRLFLLFLSNIKLFSLNHIQKENWNDPFKDFHNYQKKQKEIKKYCHLISDNIAQMHSYFEEVFKYEKDKKFNSTVIKAFVNLMSKNMVLLKIQQNYNTQSLQCQAKYLYIESYSQISLKSKRNTADESQFPAICFIDSHWTLLKQRENYSFKLLDEVRYPLPWGKHNYFTRNITVIRKTDIWMEEIQ